MSDSDKAFSCVWQAIEDSPAAAEHMRIRLSLMMAIRGLTEARQLSQADAAQLFNVVYWAFFAWRYYSGYEAAVHPEQADALFAVASSSLAAGLINGLILGPRLRLLRFFKLGSANLLAPR